MYLNPSQKNSILESMQNSQQTRKVHSTVRWIDSIFSAYLQLFGGCLVAVLLHPPPPIRQTEGVVEKAPWGVIVQKVSQSLAIRYHIETHASKSAKKCLLCLDGGFKGGLGGEQQKYRNILICRKYTADNNETDDDIGFVLMFLGAECGSEVFTARLQFQFKPTRPRINVQLCILRRNWSHYASCAK